MQDRITRHGTAVVSRATTAGVFNGHGEVQADTKSHQWTIHTKVPSARGAENFMQQGKASRRLSCIDRMVAGAPVCHGINAAVKLDQGSGHGWIQQESYASNTRQIHTGNRLH
jgi:hypothetical protein